MISKESVSNYCKDDISLIENYEEAVSSKKMYHCHHRLETELSKTKQELIDMGLYWKRPASELIFLTPSEHMLLHNTKPINEEDIRAYNEKMDKQFKKEIEDCKKEIKRGEISEFTKFFYPYLIK